MTRDLCHLAEGIETTPVNTADFIRAVRAELERKLA